MSDPITGKTLRWTYADGPTAGKVFEHTFGKDGHVTYRVVDGGEVKTGATQATKKAPIHYDVERITDDVYAVSYLSPENGFTLTSVLDQKAGTVVSFASNAEKVFVQHGTFGGA
jgi:hypothetical protein